mmetsp:Transcript_83835/g.139908  ORF Transcript_83835/g.139908 Transcript_83835/m.139908 type:complete len:200 (+) Transcript_83835:573-1172(+)
MPERGLVRRAPRHPSGRTACARAIHGDKAGGGGGWLSRHCSVGLGVLCWADPAPLMELGGRRALPQTCQAEVSIPHNMPRDGHLRLCPAEVAVIHYVLRDFDTGHFGFDAGLFGFFGLLGLGEREVSSAKHMLRNGNQRHILLFHFFDLGSVVPATLQCLNLGGSGLFFVLFGVCTILFGVCTVLFGVCTSFSIPQHTF